MNVHHPGSPVLQDWCNKYGLKLNLDNCKIVTYSRKKKLMWNIIIEFADRFFGDLVRGSSLLRDLKIEHDYGMFQNFCRMSSEDFKILLELVEPYKKKRKTCCNASSERVFEKLLPKT
nr:unnamed protein product [Callosobruchus analis]